MHGNGAVAHVMEHVCDGVIGYPITPSTEISEIYEAYRASGGINVWDRRPFFFGPPLMMRAVSESTRPFGVKTIACLNSVMIDATGMFGDFIVPIHKEDQLLRKHDCVDGPEFDAHSIDWEKLLPRFKQFNLQELRSQELKGLS